jgi:hypothetical protein
VSKYSEEVPGRVWMRGYLDREKEKLTVRLKERKALYIANQAKMVRLRKEREKKMTSGNSKEYGTNKSEQRIIKSIGGTPIKNSGRGSVKGDGTWEEFVVDVKETEKTFTISKQTWGKVCSDALTHREKDPMLLVVLDGNTRLAVIEFEVLERLMEWN